MYSDSSTPPQRQVPLVPLAVLVLFGLAACGGGGGGGSSADTQAPTLTATPGSSNFAGSVAVSLAAMDDRDAGPAIFYTTDLSTPTAMSTPYTGPIMLTLTTVLKAIAVDATGNTSAVFVQGYTSAGSQIEQAWAASGHGNILGEAFRHWDADGAVPTSCAKCHGNGGLRDFAEDGTVNSSTPLPLGHFCNTCHDTPPNTLYADLASYPDLEPIGFPSSETASLWGSSNLCFACHQGRSSTVQVDAAVLANPGGPYGFINIHYYAAGATYFGAETEGGYQYAGNEYAGRNTFGAHTPELRSCVGCHMRGANKDHHFVPQVADCTSCHSGTTFESLSGSPGANYSAIMSAQTQLLNMIRGYASTTIGLPIAYDPASYPYFFVDDNNNGTVDAGETSRYGMMDEKLLRAAYNYQVIAKDPAGFIHNGTYLRQLQHDSIVDLGGAPMVPAPGRTGFDEVNAPKAQQWHLSGHARSTDEPFRHWDGDNPAQVPTSCARCHTQSGFADYVADGTVDDAVLPGEVISCNACHGSNNIFNNPTTRHDDLVNNPELGSVSFPSGATASLGNASNICMTCHQGRESGVSVDTNSPNTAVQGPVDYDSFDFVNRHYFAAAAILFGSEVTAAYEYAGGTYNGRNTFPSHPLLIKDCIDCHMRGVEDHSFAPKVTDCQVCHENLTDFEELGRAFSAPNVDYDGDGMGESFQHEIDGMAANLYQAMQDYARTGLPQSSPIIYSAGTYPYWFQDSDDDGLVSPGEASFPNRYRDFDRRLLRAAFNYHAAQDPASDIHNYKYTLQTLYDSLDDLDNGVLDLSAMGTRP